MTKFFRSRPSPSMVVAMVALFVALSGGAYASVALNQVRSVHIKNGEVKRADIANNAVNSAKIANGGVADVDIASVGAAKVVGKVASAATADSATSAASATTATSATSAASAADSQKLGGLAASAFVQGSGHAYHSALSTNSNTNDQIILSVPGVATVLADCAANGLDTLISVRNDSGGVLNLLGQTQIAATSSMHPNTPGLVNGGIVDLTGRQVGTTTMQVWNPTTGLSATLNISNIFCLFTASAVTNK